MDWKNIILDLLSSGYTQAQIAAEIGVRQPTISDLVSGRQQDMRWVSGQKLVALHRKEMRRTPKEPAHA